MSSPADENEFTFAKICTMIFDNIPTKLSGVVLSLEPAQGEPSRLPRTFEDFVAHILIDPDTIKQSLKIFSQMDGIKTKDNYVTIDLEGNKTLTPVQESLLGNVNRLYDEMFKAVEIKETVVEEDDEKNINISSFYSVIKGKIAAFSELFWEIVNKPSGNTYLIPHKLDNKPSGNTYPPINFFLEKYMKYKNKYLQLKKLIKL